MDDAFQKCLVMKVGREPFARKMGMNLIRVDAGYALVEMVFDETMQNIFGMAHGGAVFTLIDEAFEVASNSHGTMAVALNMNVTYTAAAKLGTTLRAEAKEVHLGGRTATYEIRVTDSEETLIAVCQALVYRKKTVIC